MKKLLCSLALLVSVTCVYAQALRIMPLGNSITQAESTRLSYRYNLWTKLRSANVSVDFVGSLNTNFGGSPSYPDPNFDRNHEGHWGWRADELLAGLPQWLTGYTPDVVLMHAGSNDAFQGNTTASTVQELKNIISTIRGDNPNVTILLAKLIGTTMSTNTAIVTLNSQMDAIAAELSTSVSRVIVVDQYTGFNPTTDTYDGVHPNALGEEKMAQKWFDAIMQLPTGASNNGLKGEYFNNTGLLSPVAVTRVDGQVNFDWGTGSPAGGVNVDNYSVRWTGQVESPVSGNVTFSTVSDDGVRLWINDVLVINNWTFHAPTTNNSAPISLTAGAKYNVRMEYFEGGVGAVARLLWSYAGQSQQPIPQSRLFPDGLTSTDLTAPGVPSGLSSSNVTQTSFTLSWIASTDNIGVTGYEVFRNGVSIGTTAALAMTINTGLLPGTTYAMTVRARDAASNWSAQSNALNVSTLNASGGTGGTGLRAEYFNNLTLTPPVVINRVDAQVNFDWGNASPGVGVGADTYSTRWTGQVESPITGNVTFGTTSDDGVRLWINDVLVINNWGVHAPTTNNSTPIALTAGVKYSVRMEFFENAGGAVARLLWSYPGQSQQAIPQLRLFPAATGNTDDLTAPSVPSGLSSSTITESSFTLSWNAATDNIGVTGYEVFRNGVSIGTTATLSMNVNTGLAPATNYAMTVRARDAAANWSSQSAVLNVTTLASNSGSVGTGLKGEYFNNLTLSLPVATTRTDPQVNFDWGTGFPGAGINVDNYSVRWTGQVESPVTGNVVFSTVSDDGVRLWVNDVLVVNNWGVHAPTTNFSAPIAMTAGVKYAIRMEYFESAIGAVARLLWSYPGQSQQPIPQSRLFPASVSLASATSVEIKTRVEEIDSKISVYPNPVNNQDVMLAIPSVTKTPCRITIYQAGDARQLFEKEICLMEGQNVEVISLTYLANGVNTILVQTVGRPTVVKKVLVNKR